MGDEKTETGRVRESERERDSSVFTDMRYNDNYNPSPIRSVKHPRPSEDFRDKRLHKSVRLTCQSRVHYLRALLPRAPSDTIRGERGTVIREIYEPLAHKKSY